MGPERQGSEAIEPASESVVEGWRSVATAVFVALFLAMWAAGRLRPEYVLLLVLGAALPWFGPWARRLSLAVSAFPITGMLYELYSLLLPYRPAVHVDNLYFADLHWFGVKYRDYPMLFPDYLALHSTPFLDTITSLSYILYLPEVFALGLYFFFSEPSRARRISLGFLLLNLLGMLGWFFFAAAPPWYVTQYGLGPADLNALPSAAGTLRFDQLYGVSLFHDFYARSVNVFGAMPSLHCGYPTFMLLAVRGSKKPIVFAASIYAAIVIFSSMYLQHHYVLDALIGIATGALAYALSAPLLARLERIALRPSA